MGFSASKTDVSLFYRTLDGQQVFVLVYVDDILVMGSASSLVTSLLGHLASAFKIHDMGTLSFFLGIQTMPVDGGFVLSQHMYMTDILKRACMEDCKSLSTPLSTSHAQVTSDEPYDNPTQYWSLAGALQYQTVTRPNLSYAVNRLCHMLFTKPFFVKRFEHLRDKLNVVSLPP